MSRGTIALFVVLTACGDDPLQGLDRPPPPPETGRIAGRLCNQVTGAWLTGITVTVRGEDLSTMTDANGTFAFDDVVPGSYTLDFDTGALVPETIDVIAGETTQVGDNQCTDPRGSLTGRACDLVHGVALPAATIALEDGPSTTAAADGTFTFTGLTPDTYDLTITATDFSEMRTATVVGGVTTDIGPVACGGSIEGNLCIGDYWLSGATVTITLGDGTELTATTSGGGHYVLDDVPAGHHTVRGEKNSFSVTFEVDVELGITTLVPDRCLRPDVRIAVVTGRFDRSENVLANLGMDVRDHYTTGSVDHIDASGVVDLIHGIPAQEANSTWHTDEDSKLWLNSFLSDLTWMSDYDIIFLSCGLNIAPLWDPSPPAYVGQALANLAQWVNDGGSLYVSDWGAEVLRQGFPGEVTFLHNQHPGHGAIALSLNVAVIDAELQAALGGATTLPLAFDIAYWEVLAPGQPVGANVMLEATIGYFTDAPVIPGETEIIVQANTPLLVHVDYGDGRILFTSMHIEVDHTPQPALPEVLEYVVFEL